MSDTPETEKYVEIGARWLREGVDQDAIWNGLTNLCRRFEKAARAARNAAITECREACMDVHASADEAAKAKDVEDNYKCGYIDAAIDCDEALFRLLNK